MLEAGKHVLCMARMVAMREDMQIQGECNECIGVDADSSLAARSAWCKLMLEAARLADDMQQRALEGMRPASDYLHAASSGLSDDSVGSYAGQTGEPSVPEQLDGSRVTAVIGHQTHVT